MATVHMYFFLTCFGYGAECKGFPVILSPQSQDHPGGRYKCNLHFVGKGTAVWRMVEPGAGGG